MKQSSDAALEKSLREDAEQKPKSLIRVGPSGRPFLDFLLHNVRESGYTDVVIVIGPNDTHTREYYGPDAKENPFAGLRFSFTVQPVPEGRAKPLGTADALERALLARPEWQDGYFTVCNSDNLYSINALRSLGELGNVGGLIDYDRAALEFTSERISRFAVIVKDEEGFLTDIVEKPELEYVKRLEEKAGRIGVSMNIFRLHGSTILPYLRTLPLHPTRHEKELPAAVRAFAQEHPRSMRTIPLSEHVPDLSSKEDIEIMRRYLAERSSHFRY
jgi:NDP-sugar pyrophosphorylase family protein